MWWMCTDMCTQSRFIYIRRWSMEAREKKTAFHLSLSCRYQCSLLGVPRLLDVAVYYVHTRGIWVRWSLGQLKDAPKMVCLLGVCALDFSLLSSSLSLSLLYTRTHGHALFGAAATFGQRAKCPSNKREYMLHYSFPFSWLPPARLSKGMMRTKLMQYRNYISKIIIVMAKEKFCRFFHMMMICRFFG